eukprot:622841-Prorocentrum_minimum.AAC.4
MCCYHYTYSGNAAPGCSTRRTAARNPIHWLTYYVLVHEPRSSIAHLLEQPTRPRLHKVQFLVQPDVRIQALEGFMEEVVAMIDGHPMSIFDGRTEYAIGQTVR